MKAHVYQFRRDGEPLRADQIIDELGIEPSFGTRKVIHDDIKHGATASLYLRPAEIELLLPDDIEAVLITKAQHTILES